MGVPAQTKAVGARTRARQTMSNLGIGRPSRTIASCTGCIMASVPTRPAGRGTQGRACGLVPHLARFFGPASLVRVVSCALGTASSCDAADANIAGLSSCDGAGELGRVHVAASCIGETRCAQSAASCGCGLSPCSPSPLRLHPSLAGVGSGV